ncbi:hypothetical protein, partial [Sporomusa sphaeroides]|uniref:hypothetical protein n=1 Tax=Sporomusa sphaeroides TaxID=47679 RepID=UPI0031581F47
LCPESKDGFFFCCFFYLFSAFSYTNEGSLDAFLKKRFATPSVFIARIGDLINTTVFKAACPIPCSFHKYKLH